MKSSSSRSRTIFRIVVVVVVVCSSNFIRLEKSKKDSNWLQDIINEVVELSRFHERKASILDRTSNLVKRDSSTFLQQAARGISDSYRGPERGVHRSAILLLLLHFLVAIEGMTQCKQRGYYAFLSNLLQFKQHFGSLTVFPYSPYSSPQKLFIIDTRAKSDNKITAN